MQRAHINVLQVIVGVSCALFLFIFQTTVVNASSIGEYPISDTFDNFDTFSNSAGTYAFYAGVVPLNPVTSQYYNLSVCSTAGSTNFGTAVVLDETGALIAYAGSVPIKACSSFATTTPDTSLYTNIVFDEPVTIGKISATQYNILAIHLNATWGRWYYSDEFSPTTDPTIPYLGGQCQNNYTCLVDLTYPHGSYSGKMMGWSATEFEAGDSTNTETRIISHAPTGSTTNDSTFEAEVQFYFNSDDEPLIGHYDLQVSVTDPNGNVSTNNWILNDTYHDQVTTVTFFPNGLDIFSTTGTYTMVSEIIHHRISPHGLPDPYLSTLLGVTIRTTKTTKTSYFWFDEYTDPATPNSQLSSFQENYNATIGAITCEVDFMSAFSSDGFSCIFQHVLAFIVPSADLFISKPAFSICFAACGDVPW